MKKYFAPAATEAKANVAEAPSEQAVVAEPTSEKLEVLKEQYKKAWGAMIAITDPTSKDAMTAKLAVWKIDGEIAAEKQAIVKAQHDAKVAEMRNQRLQLNQAQLDAYRALVLLQNDKKADPAKVAELQTAFDTAREAVDNELLAKYASSRSAKVAVATDGTDKTTGTTDQKAAILELARAGKSRKEIEDAGYKRSTVWHTTNDAIIGGESFPNIGK